MCGIIGAVITDNPIQVKERLYHIYVSQAHRGSDGAGVTILRKGKILRRRLENPLQLFDNKMVLKKKDIVLLHHRFPTSTPNSARFNHPFNDEKNTISLIHNGHISNYERLYKTLKKKGHIFESENSKVGYSQTGYYSQYGYYNRTSKITDSEVIVHLIEGRRPDKAIRVMNSSLVGQYALAWVYKGDREVYLYRKDNPIVVYSDYEGNQYFSSEYPDNPFLEGFLTKSEKIVEGILYVLDKNGIKPVASVKIKKKRDKKKIHQSEKMKLSLMEDMGYSADDWNSWEREMLEQGESLEEINSTLLNYTY